MKEEKIFVAYLARGKLQEKRILNFAKKVIPQKFNSFNCLYRWDSKNEGFTDDKYKELSTKEIQEGLLHKIKNSSNAIIIRGELGKLEDELLIGLLFADYIAEKNNVPRNYYWINHYRKLDGKFEKEDRENIFPRIFEQNDYYQNKLLKLRHKLAITL